MNMIDLRNLRACSDALQWIKDNGFESDLNAAWQKCPRADWMLWLAAKRNTDRKIIVLAACDCARLALPFTKDPRVLACIETTERWTRGEVNLDELRTGRSTAYAYAADAAADAYAAAAAAADAAADAAAYAAYAAADAARKETWTKMAAKFCELTK